MAAFKLALFFGCALLAPLTASALHFNTVVIDAGHGGFDRGGIPGQRASEKTATLAVARRLQSFLQEEGIRTVMTRSDDTFITLGRRVAIANSHRNAVFVSIHFNSARREGANGFETYYYGSSSGALAARIHRNLVQSFNSENRGVRRRGYYVLRRTRIPAVLVECGFLTNRREASLAQTAPYQQRLARKIGEAVVNSR
jgi:N-acetylmuramoyl-L-alanine amidase